MRISDWSSDVCSSDLLHAGRIRQAPRQAHAAARIDVAVPRAPVLGLAADRAVAVTASRIVAAGIAIARIAAIRIASVTVVAGISVSDAARQTGRRKRHDQSDCQSEDRSEGEARGSLWRVRWSPY